MRAWVCACLYAYNYKKKIRERIEYRTQLCNLLHVFKYLAHTSFCTANAIVYSICNCVPGE